MANIYLITNKLNNKQYVGQCICSIEQRFKTHFNDANVTIPLHQDMRKYGIENFDCQLIDVCDDDLRLYIESYYIDKFNTLQPSGYNVYRHSSNGFSNKNHTRETKDIMSQKSKLWWNTASKDDILQRNRKISDALSGRAFSAEHKKKISEHAKLRTGEKNPFYGKHHSDETKNKMSVSSQKYIYLQFDSNNNYIQSFDTVKLASEYMKNFMHTDIKLSSIEYRIRACCYNKSKTAYGFIWKMILKSSSECNDYSFGDEISH